MKYRLTEIAALCSEQGLKTNMPDKNRIDITIYEDCILSFLNLVEEDDTLVGFDGTPWHAHGVVGFMTGPNTYIDYDELDIIIGLVTGELLIVTQYLKSTLTDRWLIHKDTPFDELKYIEAGEELKIYRLAQLRAPARPLYAARDFRHFVCSVRRVKRRLSFAVKPSNR